MKRKEKLKIGVIGFGRMGQKYGKEIINHPLLELVYICDKSAKAREIAFQTFPGVEIIDNEDRIFADREIDIVGLFTLADSRPEQIRKAIKTGKHVLAEKPVAEDIRTEWELLNEVEQSNLMVAVNLFNRNAWYHKTIIDFIRSGEICDLAIVRIAHMTPGHMPQEGHAPEGPAFHDCGMHYVDVARWYAGSDYATYHAQGIRMWSYADPWWLQVHGTFQNGVVFDITQGFVYGHLAKDLTHNCYVDVIGTKGIARMTHDFKKATVDMHGVHTTITKTDDFNDKKIDVLVDVFVKSVLSGTNKGFPTMRDSVIASDVAWKMLEDATKNALPCIGQLEDMDEIIARRSTLQNGYGLPLSILKY
ncbi:MAG: Gfo/Idh/MocA family oxidoreductase [Dysgonamonadaceae bacterium]|jgi:myo-inositol 2-dehydrogenase/D-chiro-inositol 1-dehydrogenase|nr:Gfo/Idh/MocA family oxidoreductase [Dysgonamonadaceae bacterium]